MSAPYHSLESVLDDELFPEVDVGLRSGRHYSLDGDARDYDFINLTEDFLQTYYHRYQARLVRGTESYYYLLAEGSLFGQQHLSIAAMLVGQVLALMKTDTAYLARNGWMPEEKMFAVMGSSVGADELLALLAPRKRGKNRTMDEFKARKAVNKALNQLQRLGFIRRSAEEGEPFIHPRSAIMRFAGPVRTKGDIALALQRMVERGEAKRGEASPVTDEDEDDEEED